MSNQLKSKNVEKKKRNKGGRPRKKLTQEAYMPLKAQRVIGSQARFKVLYGGRGSAKSYSFADALLVKALYTPLRILCVREIQRSIKDSVHKLLSDRIDALGLSHQFSIGRDLITSRCGSQIIFKGLKHNISEVKSTEGIDLCWVEEAERVSADSWDVLIPTIRKEGSEIWISFNPENEHSATYDRFVINPPPHCMSAHITYKDNKMCPDVLVREAEYDLDVDPDKYEHIWEGKVKRYHDALIFGNKIVVDGDIKAAPDTDFLFGCDWGYSNDPLVLVRMYIKDKSLYIDREFYSVGVELGEHAAAFDSVPLSREHRIRADNSRPETISYMNSQGFNVIGAKKGAGSIAEGITFLRSFKNIFIHPRCTGSIDDFTNYRWKQDSLTREVLPLPVDKANHVPDAVRYALEPLITRKKSWGAV